MKILSVIIKNKKADSLIEVLVVLGIISTVMVGAVSVIVHNIMQLKLNEIDDTATGIMLQGMEIAKSPTEVYISDDDINTVAPVEGSVESGTTYYYSLKEDSAGNNVLNLEVGDTKMTSCSTGSKYAITDDAGTVDKKISICLQIQIVPRGAPDSTRYFDIISLVAYQIPNSDTPYFNQMRGFRYIDFVTLL